MDSNEVLSVAQPLSFLSLGLALATGIGCLYTYEKLKEKKRQGTDSILDLALANKT